MSHTVTSLTNQVHKAHHLVRLMTQNSDSCAKVIHHMTHKCESWKHHKSHTYEIQYPMTHNHESCETISSLSQIHDIPLQPYHSKPSSMHPNIVLHKDWPNTHFPQF